MDALGFEETFSLQEFVVTGTQVRIFKATRSGGGFLLLSTVMMNPLPPLGSSGDIRPDYNVIAEVLEANKISPKIFATSGRGKLGPWVIDVTYEDGVGAVIACVLVCRASAALGLPSKASLYCTVSDAATLWEERRSPGYCCLLFDFGPPSIYFYYTTISHAPMAAFNGAERGWRSVRGHQSPLCPDARFPARAALSVLIPRASPRPRGDRRASRRVVVERRRVTPYAVGRAPITRAPSPGRGRTSASAAAAPRAPPFWTRATRGHRVDVRGALGDEVAA